MLLSMLMIPLVLIVRLIAFQSARDEGEEFITRQIASFRELVQIVKYARLTASPSPPFPLIFLPRLVRLAISNSRLQ